MSDLLIECKERDCEWWLAVGDEELHEQTTVIELQEHRLDAHGGRPIVLEFERD